MASIKLRTAFSLLFASSVLAADALFNAPPGVDIWCGKAYRPTNESFNPGGWLEEPTRSSKPLLDLRIYPRMNLYTEADAYGSLIVDAALSYTNGEAYEDSVTDKSTNITTPFSTLYAQTVPYNITIVGASQDGAQSYTATTQLFKLPSRTDGGSVTKIDKLYGGLMVQDYLTSNSTAWKPLLPYSFYVSWDGWLELDLTANTHAYKDYGYNIIHVVPNAGLANEAFNFTEFGQFMDMCDELELWVMYDMRWTYKNLTSVSEQVNMLKDRKSLLLWYTGDEPDGQSDTLNATKDTYDLIKSLDPYHPVSLCLNCYNFYYANYSSGADIIMEDVYPISVNTSYSEPYGTVCNTTYGCCGCDDCQGDFEDISERLDLLQQYQYWIGGPPKTVWGVPQAFGNETFWARYPTAAEEVVMAVLRINHNAKGIVAWDWPTTPELGNVTSALAKTLTADDLTAFLLGAPTMSLSVVGGSRVDAAGWMVGKKMLVSVVNLEYLDTASNMTIGLPTPAKGVSSTPWGEPWEVQNGNLVKSGLSSLEVDLMIVDLE
ncbi:hypothetical protein K490DRAFT_44518 [Saccharata proteae CBS 121410]|uniref:Glycoside hydrolase subgroup catalytic core n=1 Tax=Saccharata proteae CBS 121410 TaxID=1314787 RepID=A0A9P4HUQ8_9PEZI|nr:hypothetical protein K490DRAFT_44518 [Saccharata proteae CBS 121410]